MWSGLRSLQGRKQLHDLVSFVKTARDNLDWGPAGPPPLLVKVAPDLTDSDKADIAAVVLDTGVDGLVVSNTTISRPGVLRFLVVSVYVCALGLLMRRSEL
jgi:dihydroorotate dehydrogenase